MTLIMVPYVLQTAKVASRQLAFALEEYHESDDVKHGVDSVQRKVSRSPPLD